MTGICALLEVVAGSRARERPDVAHERNGLSLLHHVSDERRRPGGIAPGIGGDHTDLVSAEPALLVEPIRHDLHHDVPVLRCGAHHAAVVADVAEDDRWLAGGGGRSAARPGSGRRSARSRNSAAAGGRGVGQRPPATPAADVGRWSARLCHRTRFHGRCGRHGIGGRGARVESRGRGLGLGGCGGSGIAGSHTPSRVAGRWCIERRC